MGLGDDLIFLGKAEEIYKQTGKKITPLYGSGWSPIFDNVEFISREKTKDSITVNARDTDQPSDIHINYYVKNKKRTILGTKLEFRKFTPTPFKLRFSDREIQQAKELIEGLDLFNYCVVNPDYKSSFFSGNKNWGFEKYQELTNRLSSHINVVRLVPTDSQYKEPMLENAFNIPSSNIRLAAAIIYESDFGVSYDGLVQHIYAGSEKPCIVIQGGLVDESVMSYSTNIHHTYKHPLTPCGSTYYCEHCKEANNAITVDEVFESCLKVIHENSSSHRRV